MRVVDADHTTAAAAQPPVGCDMGCGIDAIPVRIPIDVGSADALIDGGTGAHQQAAALPGCVFPCVREHLGTHARR